MFIHSLLRLAMSHPHVLGEHVEAYAALAGEELTKASTSWAVRIGLVAGAGLMALVGLVLVGVALLIAATLRLKTIQRHGCYGSFPRRRS